MDVSLIYPGKTVIFVQNCCIFVRKHWAMPEEWWIRWIPPEKTMDLKLGENSDSPSCPGKRETCGFHQKPWERGPGEEVSYWHTQRNRLVPNMQTLQTYFSCNVWPWLWLSHFREICACRYRPNCVSSQRKQHLFELVASWFHSLGNHQFLNYSIYMHRVFSSRPYLIPGEYPQFWLVTVRSPFFALEKSLCLLNFHSLGGQLIRDCHAMAGWGNGNPPYAWARWADHASSTAGWAPWGCRWCPNLQLVDE